MLELIFRRFEMLPWRCFRKMKIPKTLGAFCTAGSVIVCEGWRAYSSPTRPTSLRSRRLRRSDRCPGCSDRTRTGTPRRCRWLPSHLKLRTHTDTHADVLNRRWERWYSSQLSEALWSSNASLLSLSETKPERKMHLRSLLRQGTCLHTRDVLQTLKLPNSDISYKQISLV